MSIKQNSKSSINCLKSFNSFPVELKSVSSVLLVCCWWSILTYNSSYLQLKCLWQRVSHLGAMNLLPGRWCESVCSQGRASASDDVDTGRKNGSKSTSFNSKCILLGPLESWRRLLPFIQEESHFILGSFSECCTRHYEWPGPAHDRTTRNSNSIRIKEICLLLVA